MATDDPNEPDELQDDAEQQGEPPKSPPSLDESTVDVGEKTVADVLESTVDSIEDQTQRPRGRASETIDDIETTKADIGQTMETVVPFGIHAAEQKVGAQDLDRTLGLNDATIQLPAEQPADQPDPTAQTVAEIDVTVELGADGNLPAGAYKSVMVSPDIVRTINPRELTPEDAEIWGSLAVSKSGKPTEMVPAIERSFTETKLQIRPRHVVTPTHAVDAPSDFRLIRLLGKGGMGNVFVAKQESLDRMIAVKVIKPLEGDKRDKLSKTGRLTDVEADRRHQFLSEAVVTGDLDHPNIVPIYDIAVTGDNSLFYAMKRVVGTPWSKVLSEKTLSENLDILLKASDAIGFAHTRGVVHRDIKPENIMLGDFGVVMVMDWGLALAKPGFEKIDSIAHTAGLGGTPAFMAPEMATGPVDRIGPASDIYLLGATLFQIITGAPPHQADNVSACIRAVAVNEIREVRAEHQGELMNIALKAMQTSPDSRFADVRAFQTAIREYLAHAESIALASRAQQDLTRGQDKRDYNDFSRATYGFEDALALWSGNDTANVGLEATKLAHADAAYENGDYDLGLSILDPSVGAHQPLIHKLREGVKVRESRQSRLVLFKRVAAAMLLFILVGGGVALKLIVDEKDRALDAQGIAERANRATKVALAQVQEEKQRVEDQRAIALANEQKAKENEQTANENKKLAEQQRKLAEDNAKIAAEEATRANDNAKKAGEEATRANDNADKAIASAIEAENQRTKAKNQEQLALYEVYLSKIGLAKARIDRNEFDDARRILQSLRKSRGTQNLGWEWRWLWRQSNQSQAADKTNASAIDLAISDSGSRAAVVLEDGSIELLSLAADGTVQSQSNVRLAEDAEATAITISPAERLIAVGTRSGEIQVWDDSLQNRRQKLIGHEGRINDLAFTQRGFLISASDDRTARVWDPSAGAQLASCWHIAPVQEVDVAERGDITTVVTAVADSSTGRAVVWMISGSPSQLKATRTGEFLEHDHPVSSIAIAPHGDLVATGDAAGNILLWRPGDVGKTDYVSAIADAIDQVNGQGKLKRKPKPKASSSRLIDQSAAAELVSVQPRGDDARVDRLRAHADIVESIRFSDDGQRLLSTSDDYTLKLWDLANRSLAMTLRGHGGWVTDADFVSPSANQIISISKDATIRSWNSNTYVGAVSMLTRSANDDATGRHESQAHLDEIWSARFDPSGQRIVSASRDHTARILQVDPQTMTFKEIARLRNDDQDATQLAEGTSFLAMSVAIDRAHQRLYIGSADSTVRVWDLTQGTEIGQATGTGLNHSLALSRNGRLLLTGSSSPDAKAILWDIDPASRVSPRQRFALQGHDQAVTAYAISPDSRYLFTGDRVGLGIIWDAATGRQVGPRIEQVRGVRINAASFSADGSQLLIAADDQQVSIIGVSDRELIGRLSHEGFVTQLSLSADGTHALTVAESRTEKQFQATARLWNLNTRKAKILDRVAYTTNSAGTGSRTKQVRINSAQFGPQSRMAIVSQSGGDRDPGQLKLFQVEQVDGGQTKGISFSLPATIGAAQIAVPISSRNMLTLNGDAAFLWDLQTMSHVKSYRAHGAVTRASFSFDGQLIATGSRSVKIWDAATGVALSKLENPHRGPVRAAEFSPVGSTYVLATAGDDGIARIWTWDPATKEFRMIRELKNELPAGGPRSAPIRSLAFSPDGKSLLVVGARGMVRLWELNQNPPAAVVYDLGQTAAMTCGRFAPDGKWIVVGGDDKLARMWAVVAPGQQPAAPIMFEGHADRIEDIAVLIDGSNAPRVFTAARDKSARVWDPRLDSTDKTAREVVALRRHTQGVTAIDVTASGELVMTAGRDGAVVLWPASPREPPTEVPNLFEGVTDAAIDGERSDEQLKSE